MPRAADGGGRVIPGFGAPAAPVPRLHLVSVVGGGESAMLGHLIAHYRHLGVESFRIIRHAESTAAPEFEAIKHYARAAGVELHRTYIGPLDNDVQGRLMSEAMAERPEDWYILADLDEFHLYDRPLDDLLELCEHGGHTHVCGCYVDRVSANGTLRPLTDEPLWSQFPLGGAISARLIRAIPLKCGLALGWMGTGDGHHGSPCRTGLPRAASYIQVHHFKWTGSLIERMSQTIDRFDTGAWACEVPYRISEIRRLLDYFDQHKGIDVTDPKLVLSPCGPTYNDLPSWPTIAEISQGWARIFEDIA